MTFLKPGFQHSQVTEKYTQLFPTRDQLRKNSIMLDIQQWQEEGEVI